MLRKLLWNLGEALVMIAVLAWLVAVFAHDPLRLRDDGFLGAVASLVGFLVPVWLALAGWARLRDQHKPAEKQKATDS